MAMSQPQSLPYAIEVSPDSTLQFTITNDPPTADGAEGASRCVMTLRHPGLTNQHLAFKVKTTQPRRYLVRPNQGIVAPGSSETVSILLVDKERYVLWSTYDRLGQSALDHSKDKFLVQSCVVSDEFSSQFRNEPRGEAGQYKPELIEALTAMWNSATAQSSSGSGSVVPMFNKKLHVRHVAVPNNAMGSNNSATGGGASVAGTVGTSASMAAVGARTAGSRSLPTNLQEGNRNNTDQMSPDQMYEEVTSLRRKYDELVAFSVNLTAERDILNNTLEQTKRDLNREMATRSALEKQGLKVSSRTQDLKSKQSKGGVSMRTLVMAMVITFLFAVKATNNGSVGVLKKVPVLSKMLGFKCCSKHKTKEEVVENVETDEL
ncbi:hypothetical protein ACHAWU_010127 [Discostella pseudostelligera]|uniref:MSP domain-containing protein n=1 Tax=Discostella pseudostelligera TaxID=259834 RepID=A0ABD3MCV8_9STRA